MEYLVIALQVGVPVGLLVLGYLAGKYAEVNHYASIRAREKRFVKVPLTTFKTLPDDRPVIQSRIAVGSVVVSVDHFKRFLLGFRKVFGGEIRSYSPLIDRGRREAILRMRETSPSADAFINCRVETSTISNGMGKAVGTVEVLAYATAIRYEA